MCTQGIAVASPNTQWFECRPHSGHGGAEMVTRVCLAWHFTRPVAVDCGVLPGFYAASSVHSRPKTWPTIGICSCCALNRWPAVGFNSPNARHHPKPRCVVFDAKAPALQMRLALSALEIKQEQLLVFCCLFEESSFEQILPQSSS